MQLLSGIRRLLRRLGARDDAHERNLEKVLRNAGVDVSRFEKIIGYRPHSWRNFLEALLHRSYLQFVDSRLTSNERLEFLGDAILNFVVAERLFRSFPDMEEGNLTKIRSRLVNRKVLALRSRELHLTEFLLLSASAAQSLGGGAESILSDAYESVVGAIFVDGGLEAARKFIERSIFANPDVLASAMTDDNFKSALLEYVQGRSMGSPRYVVVREDGPEHDRRFTVEVFVKGECLGAGSGRSKKDAEQSAAAKAIEHIHRRLTTKAESE